MKEYWFWVEEYAILMPILTAAQAYFALTKEQAAKALEASRATAWMRHHVPFDPSLMSQQLSALAAIVQQDPWEGSDGIVELAHFYRQWLVMSENPLVSLNEEKALLMTFGEVMQKEGLVLHWDWVPGPGAWKLPPFTLFALAALLVGWGVKSLFLKAEAQANGLRIVMGDQIPIAALASHPLRVALTERLQFVMGDSAQLSLDNHQVCVVLPGLLQ